jgi:hypothetical protein
VKQLIIALVFTAAADVEITATCVLAEKCEIVGAKAGGIHFLNIFFA